MSLRRVAPALACTVIVACADVREEPQTSAPPTSASATDGSDEGVDPTAAADTAMVLDVGADTGAAEGHDPDSEAGCDKVDFLFVIDHSGSMADEQQTLIESFGPFMDAIEARVGDSDDFHVMVTDVDAWVFGECVPACNEASACDAAGTCQTTDECLFPCALRDVCEDSSFMCGKTQPLECEDVLGAGVTHPRGRASSETDCSFHSDKRFIDASEADLASAFACAAKVGTGSSADTEQPMDAMVAALAMSGDAAACNEGFLRDDAILVVTFITDEDDDPTDSTGNAAGWHQAIVDAKGGDEQAVVVLGLFGDNDEPGGICTPLSHDFATGAEAAPRLREFVGMWGDRGHIGSICATDYSPFFSSAVDSIGIACDEFVPQG